MKKEYLEKVQTIDDLITAFYACLGGEPGEKRDWDFMKYLFHFSDRKKCLYYKSKFT